MENNIDEALSSDTGGGGSHPPNPNPNPNSPRTPSGSKGKACRGCTYYSSVLKSKSKNPRCIGFTKTIQQVPPYGVRSTEIKGSKEGRNITNFKYTCIGYSIYLDNKDSPAGVQDKPTKLPFCAGLEVVINSSASDGDHVPAHARKTESTMI